MSLRPEPEIENADCFFQIKVQQLECAGRPAYVLYFRPCTASVISQVNEMQVKELKQKVEFESNFKRQLIGEICALAASASRNLRE